MVERTSPVSVFVIRILAAGIPAPLASVTVPTILAACCPYATVLGRAKPSSKIKLQGSSRGAYRFRFPVCTIPSLPTHQSPHACGKVILFRLMASSILRFGTGYKDNTERYKFFL